MKTISDYTIYCTEEQTKKALELGAPIEIKTIEEAPKDWQGKAFFTGMATCAKLPTAEQMIGWIRTKGCTPYVYPVRKDRRIVLCARLLVKLDTGESDSFHGYGEDYSIILAAIDAALEYLSNNKKKRWHKK